ncbi:ThiF family adenylyltransferase [Octadecabacter sp. 1_MG-2023]|uniref:HesA/MoeB/ThiF family protein n=1 Tax=unclassified Octadecabacter TaxID=196158 RepID=UPI001C08AF36|nr:MULTISPECIES: ThiF family adenylyltransferase [unclassified Octadecabacter]MBU2993066.1 ThiF family adenylyltransferase [Octadecabacter sp. B2R22]MDO6733482.1 ThiF family adenylyltransferase [Octadecabacter sp. 1_MG-2023]
MFDYEEFTTRNIGFVTRAEQDKLRGATVFVCGTGGMGGACILGLVRAGVGKLIIADLDEFEVSNLNRQVFAFTHTIDRHKADATAEIARQINPEIEVEVHHADWTKHVDDLITRSAIVVNGTDDLGASLLLYRRARVLGKTVIDAYASPLPSIYVTLASDTPHEERLGYPTTETSWDAVSDDQRSQAFIKESEWVVIHSSSRNYIDLDIVGDVVAGKRSRMSFGPMVITTGQLMCYEAVNAILGRSHGTDNRGYFFNPYKARVERPKPAFVAALMRPIVRRFLNGLMS